MTELSTNSGLILKNRDKLQLGSIDKTLVTPIGLKGVDLSGLKGLGEAGV